MNLLKKVFALNVLRTIIFDLKNALMVVGMEKFKKTLMRNVMIRTLLMKMDALIAE